MLLYMEIPGRKFLQMQCFAPFGLCPDGQRKGAADA